MNRNSARRSSESLAIVGSIFSIPTYVYVDLRPCHLGWPRRQFRGRMPVVELAEGILGHLARLESVGAVPDVESSNSW